MESFSFSTTEENQVVDNFVVSAWYLTATIDCAQFAPDLNRIELCAADYPLDSLHSSLVATQLENWLFFTKTFPSDKLD